jgi:hypothetical protein
MDYEPRTISFLARDSTLFSAPREDPGALEPVEV